jgi:hypothetical protein
LHETDLQTIPCQHDGPVSARGLRRKAETWFFSTDRHSVGFPSATTDPLGPLPARSRVGDFCRPPPVRRNILTFLEYAAEERGELQIAAYVTRDIPFGEFEMPTVVLVTNSAAKTGITFRTAGHMGSWHELWRIVRCRAVRMPNLIHHRFSRSVHLILLLAP